MVGLNRPTLAVSAAALLLSAGLASAQTIQVLSVNYDGPDADSAPDQPSADLTTDNDYTRLENAMTSISQNNTVVELFGEFDLTETNAEAAYNSAGELPYPPTSTYSGLTLIGMDAAAIVLDKENGAFDTGFYQDETVNDLTIDNIEFRGFELSYWAASGGINTLTIQNCTFYMGTYDQSAAYGMFWQPQMTTDMTVDGNTFYHIVNAGIPMPDPNTGEPTNPGYTGTSYGFVGNCCNGNAAQGMFITNNTFNAYMDPALPQQQNSRFTCIYDNNNSNRGASSQSVVRINNNTFDMGLDLGSGIEKFWGYGIIPTGIDERVDGDVGAVYEFDGNSFANMPVAFYPVWFDATDPDDGTVITDTTFTNMGYNDPNNQISPPYEVFYAPAIRNATAGGFGVSGGSRVLWGVNNTWEGVSGIPALNDMSVEPLAFEMSPADEQLTAFSQAGILAAEVIQAPATTFNRTSDDEWTFDPYWSFPTPPTADGGVDISSEEAAIGYNAFGNPVPQGDPNIFVDDPADPLVVDISVDTEYAPGTIIDKDVTIRRDPNLKFGAPDTPVVSPTVKELGSPLFVVEAGGTLTIQDLVIDGDTPFPGPKDVNSLIKVMKGGEVIVENSTLKNAFAAGIDAEGDDTVPADESFVTVTGSYLDNLDPAIRAVDVSDVSVSNSLLGSVRNGIIASRDTTVSFDTNVFNGPATDFFFINAPTIFETLNNLYFTEVDPYFNGEKFPTAGTFNLNIAENWHNEFYGYGAQETDGLITGDVPVVNSAGELFEDKDFTAGVLTYDMFDGTEAWDNSGFTESQVVAQLDRDLDAWPDAWELADDNYTKFDSDGDGWPDGVEAAQGTDPRDGGDFPAGVFDINLDADDNGIVDWYEDSFATNTGVEDSLGDVLRDGDATLTDAVRSLQIVNGQFGSLKSQIFGDLNALDVSGLGVNSLANPLQILRFQAGVRDKLPALPGID